VTDRQTDYDFVVLNDRDFKAMISTLTAIAFQRTADAERPDDFNTRLRSQEMLQHPRV
jgi:hypothetical protein